MGDTADGPSSTSSRRRRPFEVAVLVGIAVAVAILIRTFVAQSFYIPSASMLPGLHLNDRVVVSRLAYDLHAPRRGDVVVFSAPPGLNRQGHPSGDVVVRALHDVAAALGLAQNRTVLIKRVIALPGETVEGRNGHVYVAGHLLLEPYLAPGTLTSNFGPFLVGPGTVWVMGDNRPASEDSRAFGPIPERTIIGRAVWRVWPPDRLGFL